ncbi:unnamed protein product [Schistosoma curassoni]|uniref:PHD domain-containing protein n=1 Tax=Schistosoma curassoni TaxID=6186 RepID=A0A183L841_9TREM|nr:unnamed protein product [Schistosoma curassoni]
MKNTVITLVRRPSEEQCSSLYSRFYQELHGRLPPTPLNLQAEPQLYTGTSIPTNFTTPLMHRGNVDLDETSSNDGDDVVSVNSEELTGRDIQNEEEDEENRLCDICNLAQPPCETGDEVGWVFCPCEAMFHRFCAYDPSPNVRAVHCPMCGAITN